MYFTYIQVFHSMWPTNPEKTDHVNCSKVYTHATVVIPWHFKEKSWLIIDGLIYDVGRRGSVTQPNVSPGELSRGPPMFYNRNMFRKYKRCLNWKYTITPPPTEPYIPSLYISTKTWLHYWRRTITYKKQHVKGIFSFLYTFFNLPRRKNDFHLSPGIKKVKFAILLCTKVDTCIYVSNVSLMWPCCVDFHIDYKNIV